MTFSLKFALDIRLRSCSTLMLGAADLSRQASAIGLPDVPEPKSPASSLLGIKKRSDRWLFCRKILHHIYVRICLYLYLNKRDNTEPYRIPHRISVFDNNLGLVYVNILIPLAIGWALRLRNVGMIRISFRRCWRPSKLFNRLWKNLGHKRYLVRVLVHQKGLSLREMMRSKGNRPHPRSEVQWYHPQLRRRCPPLLLFHLRGNHQPRAS